MDRTHRHHVILFVFVRLHSFAIVMSGWYKKSIGNIEKMGVRLVICSKNKIEKRRNHRY